MSEQELRRGADLQADPISIDANHGDDASCPLDRTAATMPPSYAAVRPETVFNLSVGDCIRPRTRLEAKYEQQ